MRLVYSISSAKILNAFKDETLTLQHIIRQLTTYIQSSLSVKMRHQFLS